MGDRDRARGNRKSGKNQTDLLELRWSGEVEVSMNRDDGEGEGDKKRL